MGNAKDITGQHFGHLVALYPTEKRARGGYVVWVLECTACGSLFECTLKHLRPGGTISCGCVRREKASERAKSGCIRRRHGFAPKNGHKKIYSVWAGIKNRCLNPNSTVYRYYGGRGILICDDWKNDFQKFYEHVSKLPHFGEEGRSIDRINNDGNYEPGNVRWATRSEQRRNQRERKEKGNGTEDSRVQSA